MTDPDELPLSFANRLSTKTMAETLALLNTLPVGDLMIVLLVVFFRAQTEGTLTPADRLWLLRMIEAVLRRLGHQAA